MQSSEIAVYDINAATRLRLFRSKYINKSQNKASADLKISQSNLSLMEKGLRRINLKFISELSEKYKLNADWLATGHGDPQTVIDSRAEQKFVVNKINTDLNQLQKYIKMMEINQTHMLTLIERQNKKIEALEKKIIKLQLNSGT